ncbi:MAG: TolC family protein [Carboxylicivirga sp.]|nr:TolC family protein [Carboxylicivirga sp.]
MRRLVGICLILLLGLHQHVWSQEEGAVALEDLIRQAIRNNYAIINAERQVQQAQYGVSAARANRFPQLTFEAQADHYMDLPVSVLPGELVGEPGTDLQVVMGTAYNSNAGIKANQLLFSRAYLTGVEQAKLNKSLMEIQAIKTQEDVIYQTASLYYQYEISLENLSSLESNLTRLVELEKVSQLMLDQGVAIKTELDRIRIDVTNLKAMILQQSTIVDYQKKLLKLLIGWEDSKELMLKKLPLSNPDKALPLGYEAGVLTDIKLLETQLALQHASEKGIKASRIPVLSAFGQFSYDAKRRELNFFNPNYRWNSISVVGLRLSMPLFDGGNKRAQIKQQQLAQSQTLTQIDYTTKQLQTEYQHANNQINNSILMLEVQKENALLAHHVYDQTKLQYKEGITDLTDLLSAETALRDSELTYYQSYLNYKLAQLDLWKTQGNLKDQLIGSMD